MRTTVAISIVFALTSAIFHIADAELDVQKILGAFKNISDADLQNFQSSLQNGLSTSQSGRNMSAACSAKMAKLTTTEIKDLFPMVDALGKPGSGLFQGNFLWPGSFSQCADMKGFKYCLAGFSLKLSIYYKKVLDQQGGLGACMPQECNKNDIQLILSQLPLKLNYPPFVEASILFSGNAEDHVACEDRNRSYSSGTIVTLTLCGIILALCFVGTCFELTIDWLESPTSCIKSIGLVAYNSDSYAARVNHGALEEDVNTFASQNSLGSDVKNLAPLEPKKSSAKDGRFMSFLICFSLVKNTKAVLNTDTPSGAILPINGIRTISMFWVILGHVYAIGETAGGLENGAVFLKLLDRFTFLTIENAFFSVDTFFVLSGLLVAYLGVKRLEAKGKLPIWQFYLHRYIRLTPTYAFVILFFMYIFPIMGSGPIFSTVTTNTIQKPCEDYWWTNLIYINNFHPHKLGDECLGWGWYLANDMQFFIISPIILYAMYKFRIFGAILSNGVLLLICTIVTGVLFGHYKLNALEVAGDVMTRPKTGPAFTDIVYIKPYCRIQPYLIGLLLGYILFKKYSFKGTFKWLFYLIGWVWAIALGLTVVYGTWESSKLGGEPFNTAENIFYGSLSRLTWAIAVAWVVFACHNGFGGLVHSFLSWRAFIPLSRLTYGAYLLHPMTIILFYQSKLSTRAYTDLDIAFQFVSVTGISYAAAFIMAICVEFPILNLDKMLFSKN